MSDANAHSENSHGPGTDFRRSHDSIPVSDSIRARFRHNPATNQWQISFNDAPPPELLKLWKPMLEEAGYRYFAADKLWAMDRARVIDERGDSVPAPMTWEERVDMERRFVATANLMRAFNGLGPARA